MKFIVYPNISSAICLVLHREGLPVTDAPTLVAIESDENSGKENEKEDDSD